MPANGYLVWCFAQALTQRVIKQFTGYILVQGNHCKAALYMTRRSILRKKQRLVYKKIQKIK